MFCLLLVSLRCIFLGILASLTVFSYILRFHLKRNSNCIELPSSVVFRIIFYVLLASISLSNGFLP